LDDCRSGVMYYLFQHFGVAVGAVSGVLAAGGKRIDLFGVVVLGLVTALGGGTLRDVVLGPDPALGTFAVFWICDANYVVTATVYVLMERWLPENAAGGFVGAGITLALRLASIQWKLSLPVFRAES
jgi:uncharacterized membrane protein YeiH